jgi:hypothetical protein
MKFHTSAASGQKNDQSDRKRNFVVSNKGALSRSLILFVLVLVLVLGDQNSIEDEDDDEDDWSTFDFAT